MSTEETAPTTTTTPPMTAMTLTSLLNSLHTHLQSQTQLLPTLHAQLGLPPTALEDDLKNLQEQLIQGVEKQIDLRRKQVDEWMENCEAVETVCIRYTKALGGNIKATGTSLGELRKEQSLPRRYELVTEFQEKLRQTYHAKLEQLTALTNRLNHLARTLGTIYFAQDILETTPATGEAAFDATAPRDVTPERFLKLEKELVRGKAEVTKRLHQLSSLFVQIDWLHSELGMPPPLPGESPPPPTSMATDDPFCVSTPTPASRSSNTTPLLFQDNEEAEYLRIFGNFVSRIEEVEEGSHVGLEGVEPTQGLLEWAAMLQASLEELKRKREAHIQAMYDQLEGLWRRLGVNEEAMDAFVEMHRGSTEEVIRQYEEELERMLELKQDRMGQFIESAREEIVRLWDDLMVGEDEKADFAPFADDEFTEELLAIHEDEIRRLKEERRMKAPLLAGIKKYFQICDEEKELQAAAADQTRLLGRGRDPGRLLREEKMRKRVQKEKPRLEQDLLASIPAWELEACKPFLIHGESILQLLLETVAAAQEQENKRKTTRSNTRATTPTGQSGGYVPGGSSTKGGGGSVTPAVRPGSSMASSVPNKRQKLGDSTSSSLSNSTSNPTPGYAPATGQRVLRASHKGNGNAPGMTTTTKNGRSRSKTPGPGASSSSSIPKPGSSSQRQQPAMPVPRAGTQHHALGHGRVPTTATAGRSTSGSAAVHHASGTGPGAAHQQKRYTTGGSRGQRGAVKVSASHRESFKPRPSIDHLENKRSVAGAGAGNGKWLGGAAVREEEEDYDD